MKKYYYVRMLNEISHYNNYNRVSLPNETSKEVENIARNISLGYSEPSALAILGVRYKNVTTKQRGFFGIEYEETHSVEDPIFVICEDNGEYLEEVVTGNRYEKGPNYTYQQGYYDKLRLSIASEIPVNTVAAILRNLSEYEVAKYAQKIYELDRAIAIDYQKHLQRLKNKEIQDQNDDSYIKSFRKKYGK